MFNLSSSLKRWMLMTLGFCSFMLVPHSAVYAESTTIEIIPDETVDGNVELRPGYIAGTVDIGGQNISRIDLAAESSEYQAKIYPQSEGPYSLTVNVPQGQTMGYRVTGTIWMDSWQTKMVLQNSTVTVAEAQITELDYKINSGYVTGTLITNGCSLSSSELWAMKNDGGYTHATTKLGSETTFRFPAQPNAGVNVYGTVQTSTGATFNLPVQNVDIPAGQEVAVSWELPCASGQLSAIKHDIDYHMVIDQHTTYLYNQRKSTPYRTSRHEGSVLFDNLAPSSWLLYTYSYWNNNQNMIGKNFYNVTTSPGQVTHVTFDEYPGFLRGTLTLTGTHTMEDTSYAHMYAYGQNSLYPSYQTFSRSLANNVDGKFELALPYGEYSQYVTALSFYNPVAGDEYLNSYLYMYDYSKRNDLLFVQAGEVIDNYDVNLETGSAVIKFSRADGGTFSAPYINAKCYTYDDGNVLQSYSYASSRAMSADDRVTMIGFPGVYEVDAWAYVDGSVSTFGKVTIEIVPGVEKVVDIGGPSLNISSPDPGTISTEATMLVIGKATDDSGVEKITVNGIEIHFELTNNLDDPNEVQFTYELNLTKGENSISTVATDNAGNSSSDSRSVTYEPIIEETAPPAGVLDIKPGSCKNPFNVKAKGVLPVVLLGSSDLNVELLNPDTFLLNGVTPLRYVIADDAALVEHEMCENDFGDGYADLVLKFSRQEILSSLGSVNDGDVISLLFSAETDDGNIMETADIITIISRGKKE